MISGKLNSSARNLLVRALAVFMCTRNKGLLNLLTFEPSRLANAYGSLTNTAYSLFILSNPLN